MSRRDDLFFKSLLHQDFFWPRLKEAVLAGADGTNERDAGCPVAAFSIAMTLLVAVDLTKPPCLISKTFSDGG